MILRPIVISDDGGRADRIANEYRLEYKTDVHEDAVSGYPVFSGIFEKLYVVEHTYD